MSDFVHLHLHTQYSLLDGAAQISNVIKKAKEMGQTAVAITDHGVMYGAVEFYKAALAEGIRPIIGCEVYTAARSRFDRSFQEDGTSGHLVLLAKNNIGYQNLIKLVSLASLEGMYYKPRVDFELLSQYHEGIIALSACLAGDIPRCIMVGDIAGATRYAKKYQQIFGDDFYLEVQRHGLPEDENVVKAILDLSQNLGIDIVATNDVHYVEKTDARMQNVLMCIQMNRTVDPNNEFAFETDEFYLKSAEEMAELFSDMPQAIENTVKISQMCNVNFDFDTTHLPVFPLEVGVNHATYLRHLANEGLKKRYTVITDEIQQRLDYELGVIESMGFVDYFLIVQDFVNFAKDRGIPVGPGRGSGAGSIVSYCLNITEIDPLQYSLLFERFLNPERISMPDIDIDFCVNRRSEVIEYVTEKYGKHNVAQIITFGTMAAKAAIRDVGRALGVPYALVDKVAKKVPTQLGITLSDAIEGSKELQEMIASDAQIKELLDMAKRLEGFPRHASTHAAGVVITDRKTFDYVPVQLTDNNIVTQFPMTTLEELGLLKMDFLGLRNLTVIAETERLIREKKPSFSVRDIDFSDVHVYRMLSSGKTQGVFQLESNGICNVLMRMKPTCIEDIIAVISLYRPGPMDSIPKYLQNRRDPSKVHYIHPILKDILSVTHGCIVYQEQVLQIVRTVAGYSYGRADLVRRAMSKKKMDVMAREREIFIHGMKDENGNVIVPGALARGVSAEIANKLFDEITEFAKYAFNKSHAACYAYVAYQTAFLKCHYPAEFMAAMMTSVMDNTPKVASYMEECNRLGIAVKVPNINLCSACFTTVDGEIIYGLSAIKNVGKKFVDKITAERERGGLFTSFVDFISRMLDQEMNKRAVEALIKAGAFDCFGFTRRHYMMVYENVIDGMHRSKTRNISGQFDLFGDDSEFSSTNSQVDILFSKKIPEYFSAEKLKYEKEMTGLYLSGHPLSGYETEYEKKGYRHIGSLFGENAKVTDGDKISLLGIVSGFTVKNTRNNQKMAFITLEDMSGTIEILLFPKLLQTSSSFIAENEVITVRGKLSVQGEQDVKIIADEILPIKYAEFETETKKLFVRLPSKESKQYQAAVSLLSANRGRVPCVLYFQDTGKSVSTKGSFDVDPSDTVLGKLRQMLGNENVVLK